MDETALESAGVTGDKPAEGAVSHLKIRHDFAVVIPAFNEAPVVPDLIKELREAFERFDLDGEVILVDDGSTDGTAAVLADLQAEHERLQVIAGVEPPPGWLGKPHALEQGRRRARGDWLLFVDADVVYAPELLRRAMAYAQTHDLGMLTLCPRVTTGGVIEAVLMSSVYLFAFAATPMFLAGDGRRTTQRCPGIKAIGCSVTTSTNSSPPSWSAAK